MAQTVHPCLTSSLLDLLVACRALLQLACNAPTRSCVACHARQLPQSYSVPLQLVREDGWPATVARLNHHQAIVKAVAVWQDPANQARGVIASGSKDRTIVWVPTAQLVAGCSLVGARALLQLLVNSTKSPQRSCPFCGRPNTCCRVSDLATGEVKFVLDGGGEVQCVAISAGGTCAVSGGGSSGSHKAYATTQRPLLGRAISTRTCTAQILVPAQSKEEYQLALCC